MSEFGKDIPAGLMSTVKDVLKQNQDLYGDDLRNRYNIPETPSPEAEVEAPAVPEAPEPEVAEDPASAENNEE